MNRFLTMPLDGVTMADLDWLEGRWAGQYGQDLVEEQWSAVAGGARMGMFRWICGDQVYFYEIVVLEPDRQGLSMRIKHFYPGLVGWEEKDRAVEFTLVQMDEHQAIFLEQHIENPPWLVYRLEDEGTLVVYFERESDPAKKQFVYKRQ